MQIKPLPLKSHLKYLIYVLKHKWYVFIECCKLGIFWQGLTHDLSKFSKEEWEPYAYKNFGPYKELPSSLILAFDKAWKHHWFNNPHHWEYWQYWGTFKENKFLQDLEALPLPMPDKYRKEMLADWIGFGKMRGRNDSKEFYLAKKDKIKLHPETRKWVEKALGL